MSVGHPLGRSSAAAQRPSNRAVRAQTDGQLCPLQTGILRPGHRQNILCVVHLSLSSGGWHGQASQLLLPCLSPHCGLHLQRWAPWRCSIDIAFEVTFFSFSFFYRFLQSFLGEIFFTQYFFLISFSWCRMPFT